MCCEHLHIMFVHSTKSGAQAFHHRIADLSIVFKGMQYSN